MKLLGSIFLVGAGGFIGSALRFLLALVAQRYSISFPHGTLWANLLGCLAVGLIAALAAATEVLSPAVRLLLATGLCGGFTTMSSFIYELAQLLRDNEFFLAAGYFGLTLGGCLVMFWVGTLVIRLWLKG
jgi:CrcB protein